MNVIFAFFSAIEKLFFIYAIKKSLAYNNGNISGRFIHAIGYLLYNNTQSKYSLLNINNIISNNGAYAQKYTEKKNAGDPSKICKHHTIQQTALSNPEGFLIKNFVCTPENFKY